MLQEQQDSFTVLEEWLSFDKASFRIMIVMSVLADHKRAFRGTLNDLCKEIGIQNSSANRTGLKMVLKSLTDNDYITLTVDNNVYTVSLAAAAEKSRNVKQIKKLWYRIIKDTKSETSWENLLKTFLFLCDVSQGTVFTYNEIGEMLNMSKATVGRCIRVLTKLSFPDESGNKVIRCHNVSVKSGDGQIRSVGKEYEIGLSFESVDGK